MTEEEWLASSDPLAMCDFARHATAHWRRRWVGWVQARRFRMSDRRWRLLELACCERVAACVHFPELDELLPLARRHAAGGLRPGELAAAVCRVTEWLTAVREHAFFDWPDLHEAEMCYAAALGRLFAAEPPGDGNVLQLAARAVAAAGTEQTRERALRGEAAAQAILVRDVVGNPFRPEAMDPAWLAALDGAARRLAQEIDAQGSYGELPVLADALEEAGCTSAAILGHCRSGGAHVRGCWVVDEILQEG